MSALIENAITWHEIANEDTVRKCKACLDKIIPVITNLQ